MGKGKEWEMREVSLSDHSRDPVFTRTLLKEYSKERDMILKNWHGPQIDCSTHFDLEGKERITWKRGPGTVNYSDPVYYPNIRFLTAVEMHPSFHIEGGRSDATEYIHDLNANDKTDENESILLPVFFENVCHVRLQEKYTPGYSPSPNKRLFNETLTRLFYLDMKWTLTSAALSTHNNFLAKCQKYPSIKKIVCFGLGSFTSVQDQKLRDRIMHQHLVAFMFARALNTLSASNNPVKTVLQDPLYTAIDEALLLALHPTATFVTDPDGLLEIDNETFVMSHCLPYSFLLLQITADIARPVGFMTEHLQNPDAVKPRGDMYSYRSKLSPRVEEMLEDYRFELTNWEAKAENLEALLRDATQWIESSEFWWRDELALEPIGDSE